MAAIAALAGRPSLSDRLRTPSATALLAAAGLLFALAAQVYSDTRYARPGKEFLPFDVAVLWLVAVACWLFALRTASPAPRAESTPVVPGPALVGRRRVALWVGVSLVVLTVSIGPLLIRVGPAVLRSVAGAIAILDYPRGASDPTNDFTLIGTFLWLTGSALCLWALAEHRVTPYWRGLWDGDGISLRLSRTTLVVLAITFLAAYFRFHDLGNLPLEMTSDHTEKLRDVAEIVAGRRPVYLPANAGREPLQFYWTALLVWLGLPLSFMTLKAGMAILSTLTVPLAFVVGRRVAGSETGYLTAFMLALSPWHLQITRIGLRIALAPLFVALSLALLYRALTTGSRNSWLALGGTVGAGMYGYSGYRPMAFGVVLIVVLKLARDAWVTRGIARAAGAADRQAAAGAAVDGAAADGAVADGAVAAGEAADAAAVATGGASGQHGGRGDGVGSAGLTSRLGFENVLPRPLAEHMVAAAGVAIVVAAPLIRFALDQGPTFWGRTVSRMYGEYGATLQRPAWEQFVINWKNTLLMFNLTSDQAWFQSPAGRPALETVTGALFVLGVVTALHGLARGDWRRGGLLLALPLLLLSSAMALAFPGEVPHLSRAAGALPLVMVLVALPLPFLAARWRAAFGPPSGLAFFALLVVLALWLGQNVEQRYFVEYRNTYNTSTHPTGEAAAITRAAMAMGVDMNHVYLVGWAHGWDYRALGAHLGDPFWNGLLYGTPDGSDAVQAAAAQVDDPAPKLYFVGGPFGPANVDFLRGLFPNAVATRHDSAVHEKTYWSVFVPGSDTEAGG